MIPLRIGKQIKEKIEDAEREDKRPRHRVGDEERRFHASSPSTSGKTNEKPSYIQTRQQSVQP